jgi:hypothetical protein
LTELATVSGDETARAARAPISTTEIRNSGARYSERSSEEKVDSKEGEVPGALCFTRDAASESRDNGQQIFVSRSDAFVIIIVKLTVGRSKASGMS